MRVGNATRLCGQIPIAEKTDRHIDVLQRLEDHLGADPRRIAERDCQRFHLKRL
jgi:hypothetical protein